MSMSSGQSIRSFEIDAAREADLDRLPEIEARAAMLLDPADLPPEIASQTTSVEDHRESLAEGRLLVARLVDSSEVVGFASLKRVGGEGHLEELDVDPEHGRQGIGRALVLAAIEWAAQQGDSGITLSTFEHVRWNAPFYAKLGFETIPNEELSEALVEVRRVETRLGLDVGKRVIMRCPISRRE